MKLSIIIPVYNGKKTIMKCLMSIAHQTFSDYEVIVVNDGSTDHTKEIVEDFFQQNPQMNHIFIDMDNKGTAFAREQGISQASGDYIGFVDSDDWIEEDYYQALMQEAITSDSDMVICEYQIDGKGERQYRTRKDLLEKKYISNEEAKYYLANHEGIFPFVVNKVIKKEFFDEVDLVREHHIGEDFILVSQLLDQVKTIALIPNDGYHYVMHPESQTNRGFSPLHEKMHQAFHEYYLKHQNDDEEYVKGIERYIVLHDMSILVALARANQSRPALEKDIIAFVKEHHKDYIENANDGFKAKMAVRIMLWNYKLFRFISKRM